MESNLRTCKSCNQTKAHILDKTYDYKNKRFIDENSKQWVGKKCAQCHAYGMKIRMEIKRNLIKVKNEENKN